jgi:predicted ABC-type transport system involved in lysophospholipase L1 biosynthesis ATPase subunit
MVTHDPEVAASVGRTVTIRDGRVVSPDAWPELVAEDVGVGSGGVAVLDAVNFNIPLGRVMAITAAPGGGKGVLAQALARLLVPSRGQVRLGRPPLAQVDELSRPAFMPRPATTSHELDGQCHQQARGQGRKIVPDRADFGDPGD